jgi:hypothetical protein
MIKVFLEQSNNLSRSLTELFQFVLHLVVVSRVNPIEISGHPALKHVPKVAAQFADLIRISGRGQKDHGPGQNFGGVGRQFGTP